MMLARLVSIALFTVINTSAVLQLSECNFQSLVSVIDSSADGDVVTFNCASDARRIVFPEWIWFEKNLTIDGALPDGSRVIFDGELKTRMFVFSKVDSLLLCRTDGNLVLQNLEFVNGGGGDLQIGDPSEDWILNNGGCMIVGAKCGLHVENVHFENCRADGLPEPLRDPHSRQFRGGAIFISNSLYALSIVRSTFCNNFASETGGALFMDHENLATIDECEFYYNEQNGFVTDEEYINNKDEGGGAIWIEGSRAWLSNSVFAENLGARGGAIYSMRTNIYFTDILFANNEAWFGKGGAVFHEDIDGCCGGPMEAVYRGCTFENNRAAERSGALWMMTLAGQEGYLYDCTFSGNEVVNEAYGGAMTLNGMGSGHLFSVTMTGNAWNEAMAASDGHDRLRTFYCIGPDVTFDSYCDVPGFASTTGAALDTEEQREAHGEVAGDPLPTVYNPEDAVDSCSGGKRTLAPTSSTSAPTSVPTASPTTKAPTQPRQVIWSDPMDNFAASGWSMPGAASNYASQYTESTSRILCPSPECVRVQGYRDDDTGIIRGTALSTISQMDAFNSFELQFDVTLSDVEAGDYCIVSYRYDTEADYTAVASFEGNSATEEFPEQHLSQIGSIPFPSGNAETLYVKLAAKGNSAKGGDICYFDNVALSVSAATAFSLRSAQDSNATSTGIWIAIIVSGVVVALLIAGIAFVLLRNRKMKRGVKKISVHQDEQFEEDEMQHANVVEDEAFPVTNDGNLDKEPINQELTA